MNVLKCARWFAAASLIGGTASAATVLETQGANAYGNPNWSSSVSYNLSGDLQKSRAGLIRLEDADGNDVLAYAIDLFFSIDDTDSYAVSDTLSDAVKTNIELLYNSAYASVSNATEAAGFQVALWEIVTDSDAGLDLQSGDFRAPGAAAKYQVAADLLNGLEGAETGGWNISYFSADNSGAAIVSATAVPLPAAIWMLGLGLAGLYGASRRKS